MKQSITIHPNKELFTATNDIPVESITGDTFRQIGASMLEVLKDYGGIGLSANQVGLPFNMCVTSISANDPKIMLNPRVIKQSDARINSKEGCLSVPGALCSINRHKDVTVEYEDVTGETITLEATGLTSCCLQHEIDHLKGVLMINRLDEFHKAKALKALLRFKKRTKR